MTLALSEGYSLAQRRWAQRRPRSCNRSTLHGRSGRVTVRFNERYFADLVLSLLTVSVGLTETCTVVSSSAFGDIYFGSSGSLLPSFQAKIFSADGAEITGYDQPGELVVKSPTVVLGYLNNPQANKETFQDGWMRTGDEAVVRKSPQGNEHIFIVDRIKELIKVKVFGL